LFKAKSTGALIDKLAQFMELDSNARMIMGANSRKKVEKEFDRNIVIKQYLDVIKDIFCQR
jgi:glycosyltransferase involved in cell wall biosynthesis